MRWSGEGSFGAVLTVYEADSGAEYAAKRFELNEDDGCTLSSGALIEVSFLSAIRMASLDKKGIIHLEDVCELTEEGEDILCAVVPKYNCSLEEAIQGGALTSNRTRLSIAISLLEAVAVLHSNGVVHRDIKSANVMLTEELRPVLIDFSLAKYMPEGAVVSEEAPSDSAEHTGSVGTPTYMAPELVEANGENLRYDSRVDSWSVGVVLLELFRGKVMEECKDRAAFRMIDEAKARMSDKPVPRIIKGLLEVEPDKRLKCSDAYKKLLQCSSHADKENSNEGFLSSDSSKPLSDYFGNYVVAGGAHAGELQEIRRFYHVLEMTNPTTIKAAMYYSSLFDQSNEDKPPPLHLLLLAQKIYEPRTIDLVTIDEFDEDDPQLSDFDIDEYMKDEMTIMKAANWCCLVLPPSSEAEAHSLVGKNAVQGSCKRALKGKRKRRAEKQTQKRRRHAAAIRQHEGESDDEYTDD
ncbi:hypothetical protein FOZ62_030658 [Perkinsus olseni]|uniref:Protein kinase domain-containing protein n=1 Tax=Perkinsus olseni TaxID=32597 RepID=A0A7J6NN37_PEROL|nr:hypothetical protein FOZ62_030658 [Perkinsus olseni]